MASIENSLEATIGYQFQNSDLLTEALTHPSLAYETKKSQADNQRLEYLGDAVVQLILTDELYRLFPGFGEGKLTKLRSRLVSRTALCKYADGIEIGKYLLLGKGEAANGGRERPSNLADAIEALTGAIYLDGGMAAATKFIFTNFGDYIDRIVAEPDENNPKGELQECLQAISPVSPKYRIIGQEGPDHLKSFVAEVTWEEVTLGNGQGMSKKEAEIAAAVDALKAEKWTAKSL